jgi:hypothetical protein
LGVLPHAALLDFAEAGGVGARHPALLPGKGDRLFQRLERSLAQQDSGLSPRLALDHGLGRDAALGHALLHGIDIEGARGQVVDVRPAKAHHVGDQAMGIVEAPIGGGTDGCLGVPAERLERLAHELFRLRRS